MAEGDRNRLTGRCLCGEVRVAVLPRADRLGACHCEMCRRWTGSAFVEIDVAADDLEVEGPVKSFASSDWAERAWCDRCGSTLWYRVTLAGHEAYSVAAGLFDDAGGLRLEREIFIDAKPGGYAFAGERETMTRAEVEAMFASSGSESGA